MCFIIFLGHSKNESVSLQQLVETVTCDFIAWENDSHLFWLHSLCSGSNTGGSPHLENHRMLFHANSQKEVVK